MKRWMAIVMVAGFLAAGCAPAKGGKPTDTDNPTMQIQATAHTKQTQNSAYKTERPARLTQFSKEQTLTAVAPTKTPTLTRTPTIIPTPTPSYYVRDKTPVSGPRAVISFDNADQLVELARWGKGVNNLSAYSPDGKLVIIQTPVGIYAQDAQTFREIWRLELPAGIGSMAISAAKNMVALGSLDGRILLVQLDDGTIIHQWGAHNRRVLALAFSSNGEKLVSGSDRDGVRIWNVLDARLFQDIANRDKINKVAFSKDGNNLWIAGASDGISYWEIDAERYHANIDKGVNFYTSADGEFLARYRGGYVNIYRMSDGIIWQKLAVSKNHMGPHSIQFSQDGRLIAVGYDWNLLVQVWQVSDGTLLQELFSPRYSRAGGGHLAALLPSENPGTQYINSDLAFNPRGNILASKTAYGWIELWEVNQGRFLRSIKHSAVNISFAPQGDKIIASGPWQLSLIDANDGSVLNNTPGFVRGDDLVFSPNGESLATGYSAWRVKDGEVLWALKDEKFLGYSPDGKQMITILPQEATVYLRHESDLGLIRQIKLEDPNWVGGYFWTMEGHEHVSDIYVSPNGDYLAAAHSGAGLAVWRLADGKIVPALSRYGFYIVFSPDGSLAAIPSTDRAAINLHRLEDGEIIQTIGWSELLEFSPDSKQIIGIKKDQIEVWRIEDGKLLRRFDVDMKDPVNLAISPDGQLLATTTNDHRIVLIRLDTGTVVHTINGNYWRAERLGFSPDGRMLGANLTDGTVRLWGVAP